MNFSRPQRIQKQRRPADARLRQAFARGVRDNVLGEAGAQVVRGGAMVVLALAVVCTARGGLAVSVAMSAVELTISGVGQLIAAHMLRANLFSAAAAIIPGLKTAALCGAGVRGAAVLCASLQPRGVPALAMTVLPAAAAFAWMEAATAHELLSHAFGASPRVDFAGAQGERA